MCLSLHLFSLFINNVDDQNRSTNSQRTHTQIHTGIHRSFISQLFEIIRPLCISVPVLKKTHTSLDVMKRSKTYFWPNPSLIKAERNGCAFQEIKKIDGTFMSGHISSYCSQLVSLAPCKAANCGVYFYAQLDYCDRITKCISQNRIITVVHCTTVLLLFHH